MLNELGKILRGILHLLGEAFQREHLSTDAAQTYPAFSQGKQLISMSLELNRHRWILGKSVKLGPNLLLIFAELHDWHVELHQGLVVLIIEDRAGMCHSDYWQARFLCRVVKSRDSSWLLEAETLIIDHICSHVDLELALLIGHD